MTCAPPGALPTTAPRPQFIADKTAYAVSKGLSVIFCIGEKLEEREANQTFDVNARQLKARGRRA